MSYTVFFVLLFARKKTNSVKVKNITLNDRLAETLVRNKKRWPIIRRKTEMYSVHVLNILFYWYVCLQVGRFRRSFLLRSNSVILFIAQAVHI